MGRAPCCDKASTKRGPWSPDEDAKLKVYIHAHGTGGNWIALPKKANLKRCGKSCRLRWINYLRPDIIHGNFTSEEEETIIDLHEKVGSRWSLIAAKLPRRTDNDIKNFWNTRLKKRVAERQASQQQQQRGYPMRNGAVPRSYPMRSAVGQMFPVMTENRTNPAGEQQQQHTYPMPSAGGAMFPDVSEKHTIPVCNQQQQRSFPMPSASGLFPIGVIGQTQPNGLMRPPQMSLDLNNWDQIQYDPERQAALSYQQQLQQKHVAVQQAAQRLRLVQIAQENQQQSPQQFLPGKNEVVSQWLKQQELGKLEELEKQQGQLLPVKNELVSNQPLQSRVNQIENELADLIHPFVSSPQSSTSGCSLTSSGGYESGLSAGGCGSSITSSGGFESGLSAGGCGSSMTSSGGYETALSAQGLGPVPVDQTPNFYQMVKGGAMVQKQDSASGSSVTSSDYAGGLGAVLNQASNFYHLVKEGSTLQKQDSEASSTSSEGGCDSRYGAAGGLGAVPDQASNLYDVVKEEVFNDDFLPELISPTTQRGLALGGRDWPTTSEDVLPTYQVQRPSSPIETTFDESLEMETAFAESLEMETVFM